MKVKAYVPYTLPVVFDAGPDMNEEELIELAYEAANELMDTNPPKACAEMFSEDDPDFEWEGAE